jgi:multidrug efflux pump subunit AcrA (membrane-fusion protein)
MRIGNRRRRHWLPVVAMLTATACSGPSDTAPNRTVTTMDVRVARAEIKPIARTFEAGGVVRAQTTAQLTSRVVAEVREVRVRPGDRVKQGQVVVLLDDRDLAARRAQADASLSAARNGAVSADAQHDAADAGLVLAKAHHARIQQLSDRKSATPAELDRATADLRVAEGAVRGAKARGAEAAASVVAADAAARAASVTASYSTISAPFDGLVTTKHTEPGNMASPGLPLLTLEASDGFRLEFQADEARVRSLRPGDTVAVELEGAGQGGTMSGRIEEVAHAVDPAHTFTVKVALPPSPALRSGMFARARVQVEMRNALVVPAAAVVRRGQLSVVFVVDAEGHARMRAVTTGASADQAIEVPAGLSAGEAVIVMPPPLLTDGAAVRAVGARP